MCNHGEYLGVEVCVQMSEVLSKRNSMLHISFLGENSLIWRLLVVDLNWLFCKGSPYRQVKLLVVGSKPQNFFFCLYGKYCNSEISAFDTTTKIVWILLDSILIKPNSGVP